MKYTEFRKDGKVLVAVEGSLNVKVASELQDELDEVLEMGEKDIIVDMSSTSYIDSTGLGVLVGLKEKLDEIGGDVAITGLRDYCLEVFKVTRLHEYFATSLGD